MVNLYRPASGYQREERDFVGPILPGTMRGRLVTKSFTDKVFDTDYVAPATLDSHTFDVYVSGNGRRLASNVTWTRALAIRSAQRLLFDGHVDIFEVLPETFGKFDAKLSDIYEKSPENDAPVPEPPAHDWRAASHKARAARMFINKTVVNETRVTGHVDPARELRTRRSRVYYAPGQYYFQTHKFDGIIDDTAQRKGFVVIDVRTLEVVWVSGNAASSRAYIEQAIARRENKVWHYRVIRYIDRLPYMARVKYYGYRVSYLGKTVCIGTRADITAFFNSHKEPNIAAMKMEKYS